MKERGILYSAAMVRALLAGRKTQTRRLVKPQPYEHLRRDLSAELIWRPRRGQSLRYSSEHAMLAAMLPNCPYGQPGDRLWVRETWMPDPPRDGTWPSTSFDGCKPRDMSLIPERFHAPAFCIYRATWEGHALHGWTPAIHMFRWASRMVHELTLVRCERLQEISEADAIAEGLAVRSGVDAFNAQGLPEYGLPEWAKGTSDETRWNVSAVQAYRSIWSEINGPDSWDANPWVWALSFKEAS